MGITQPGGTDATSPGLVFRSAASSLVGAAGPLALATLVDFNRWLATHLVAAFAAPLCCGAPLAALFGVPLVVRFKVAPLTMALSLLLLAANLAWPAVRARRGAAC